MTNVGTFLGSWVQGLSFHHKKMTVNEAEGLTLMSLVMSYFLVW